MAKTSYLLTRTPNSAGECQIVLRVYARHDYRLRAMSNIWVSPKRWGKKNGITIPAIPGEEQERLQAKKELLRRLTLFLEEAVSAEDDKTTIDRLWGEKQVKKFHKPPKVVSAKPTENLFTLIEEYLTKHNFSESRVKHFNVLKRSLQRFELYKRETDKKFRFDLPAFTYGLLSEIEWFLGNEHDVFTQYPEIYLAIPYSTREAKKSVRRSKPALDEDGKEKPKGVPVARGMNTVSDMMTRLRSFAIWANESGLLPGNPFKGYYIGESVYGTPIYITNEERKQLYQTDMSDNPQLAIQRDIYVFQSLVGCRVGNLYSFTPGNIIGGALEYVPKKTKDDRAVTVRVPLNDTAKEILSRYCDPERKALFPFIAQQKYNEYIKEAFKRAGLTRMVTVIDQRTRLEVQRPLNEVASSHMARRTFIGNIYKKVKDPNLVGALSGHKEGSKAFARYRDIDEEMKKELISFLD